MKHVSTAYLLAPCVLLSLAPPALSSVSSKVTREVIEETIEHAARRSGRKIGEQAVRKSASETLERLTKTYGDDVLKVVRDGGLELIEAVPKYGDDVIDLAIKASPAARRALARDLPGILPLVRRVGVDALELEARTPGIAAKVFTTFGDDGGRIVAKHVPTQDVPRLLSYAEKADGPATRDLLLQSYRQEGRSLFERVPAKLVLTSGLTASMLYGTRRLTEPADAMSDAVRDNKEIASTAIRHFIGWGAVALFALTTIMLWRFHLMPWHGKKRHPVQNKEE